MSVLVSHVEIGIGYLFERGMAEVKRSMHKINCSSNLGFGFILGACSYNPWHFPLWNDHALTKEGDLSGNTLNGGVQPFRSFLGDGDDILKTTNHGNCHYL